MIKILKDRTKRKANRFVSLRLKAIQSNTYKLVTSHFFSDLALYTTSAVTINDTPCFGALRLQSVYGKINTFILTEPLQTWNQTFIPHRKQITSLQRSTSYFVFSGLFAELFNDCPHFSFFPPQPWAAPPPPLRTTLWVSPLRAHWKIKAFWYAY